MIARSAGWSTRGVRGLRSRFGRQCSAPAHQWFRGDYRTWADAVADADGYSDPLILEGVSAASRASRDEPGLHERDGVLVTDPWSNVALLASLLRVAVAHAGRLHVLDIGGSLGSTYRQARAFLADVPQLSWSVVEQPHFVARGREEFATSELQFYADVSQVPSGANVALLSGVLPYLEAPYELLSGIMRAGVPWIIVDRTPLIDSASDMITVQHVPASIYGKRVCYPARLFSRTRLLDAVSNAWPIRFEAQAQDGRWDDGGRHIDFRFLLAGPAR